ncbi:MAG: 5-formyltetrahydrofolate cyclo-ligase [Firmicutes bacterium]|nr:5-formyltetrahydrofolate cyclo-ligase [Bacillota bacterium]
MDKGAWRRKLRAARAALEPVARSRFGERMADHLLALPEAASARVFLLYAAVGAEAPTRPLAERLWAAGRVVCLPRLIPGRPGEMEAVPVPSWGGLVASPPFGIPEPPGHWPAVGPHALDEVIVPGVGFDLEGRRLGQGGGYYDRYLARLPARVLRVGWAFSVQVVDRLPEDAHDQRVHVVITETGAIRCRIRSA